MRRMKDRGREAEWEGSRRGYSRSGTYPQPSIVSPTPPHPQPVPLIASCFIFAFSALDNAVTAYGALELLFEPEVDDGFKWWVAGGVKHGLILCG